LNEYDPAIYSKPTTQEVNEQDIPKTKEMADFIGYYISNDLLGMIANKHMALADERGQFGLTSLDCLKLSKLQAIAVDFAKHGKCVNYKMFKDI